MLDLQKAMSDEPLDAYPLPLLSSDGFSRKFNIYIYSLSHHCTSEINQSISLHRNYSLSLHKTNYSLPLHKTEITQSRYSILLCTQITQSCCTTHYSILLLTPAVHKLLTLAAQQKLLNLVTHSRWEHKLLNLAAQQKLLNLAPQITHSRSYCFSLNRSRNNIYPLVLHFSKRTRLLNRSSEAI